MFTVCTSVRESPARHSSLSSPLSTQTSNTLDIDFGSPFLVRLYTVGKALDRSNFSRVRTRSSTDRTGHSDSVYIRGLAAGPTRLSLSALVNPIGSHLGRDRGRTPPPVPPPQHTNERENCTLWRSEPKPCTQTIESETAHSGTHSGTLARCTARARLAVQLAETSGSRERTTARAHHGAQATGARALCRCFMISRARTA